MPELDRCKHEMLPGQCAICNGQLQRAQTSEHDLEIVKQRFKAAGLAGVLEDIRARADRLTLDERPFVRALMFTPGEAGLGARMVFTVAAPKEKPGQVWLYNGYTAAIHEFWPNLSVARIRDVLGPENQQGYGRYLSPEGIQRFMEGLERLLSERSHQAG